MDDKDNIMKEIEELFNFWNELNEKVEEHLGAFEMSEVKNLRMEQSKTEDTVYELLKQNASPEIAKILPEGCGEMDIGLNLKENAFYYIMEDPDPEKDEYVAIVFGIDEKVKLIKNIDIENY